MSETASARGLFVTGTDTGVGKTLVASALVSLFVQNGLRTAGMKPVASGAFHDGQRWCNEDAQALRAVANVDLPPALVNPYLFRRATAPHIAAAEEGVTIDIGHIAACYRAIAARSQMVVVEGAGGFMVPLDDASNSDSLAARLGLPMILVVGIRLGCINHALLTQQAIRARSLPLAGWVANRIDPHEPVAGAMIDSLRQRIDAPLLGVLPWAPGIDAAQAARLLDPRPLGLWGMSELAGSTRLPSAQGPA
ncbi:dethiobiotin synthase [Herbaspirillum sp. alder98]|uniref:dethiobiotin synthase n=1 Tax=Herbaspirillum sp. alder98 TaxID=2913096 RepID=UPI001CD8AF1E|nr:dethiobiotin synthase [Herbaspirillum sp. alder98]MCA1327048.1 dethiobiotin synthase [Herbaspirillum sp. alder98]